MATQAGFSLLDRKDIMSIQALRERKNHLVNQCKKQMADKGDQTWSKEDQTIYDAATEEIERLSKQIEAYQVILDRDAQDIIPQKKPGQEAANTAEEQISKIFDKWLRRGDKAVSDEEWALIRNTMSTTTPSEGGYTVQTTVATSVIDAVKAFGGMRRVANQITTERGEPMQFPTSDGTGEQGEIVGENAAAADQDIAVGTVGLNVFRFSSKVVTVPMELIQDSQVDIMAFINERLRTRLGRVQNNKFTVGSGVGEPRGLVTALSVGKLGAGGQTGSVIFDDLVDLQESVDDGYAEGGNTQWMLHQQSRRILRKLKDTAGRPIWMPGYELGITKGSPDELLGRPVVINNDMPTMAASAKSIAYGDFSFYKVRDALDILLMRFTDSAYAKKGQVGFLAFMRSGGNWTDVGGAAKAYQNAAA